MIVFATDERNTGDGRRFSRSGRTLAAALSEHDAHVDVFELDTDHQGTCSALCDRDSPVFAAALAMAKSMMKP